MPYRNSFFRILLGGRVKINRRSVAILFVITNRGVTINRTGQHRTAPGPYRARVRARWLIISLRQLLQVELRRNSEPTVLGAGNIEYVRHQLITNVD